MTPIEWSLSMMFDNRVYFFLVNMLYKDLEIALHLNDILRF